MRLPRRSGILLHPTSLPGRYGIGDLGNEAYRFVDVLVAAQQSLWQILPLGPTGYGDSPYQCLSAVAGNPLLISPDLLVADRLLTPAEVRDVPNFPAEQVAFGAVIPFKHELLARAARRLALGTHGELSDAFAMFRAKHAAWLDDFALFMALKEAHQGAAWSTWEPDIARRTPEALARWRQRLAETVTCQQALQFLFFRQWLALKQYANARGIRMVGDVPIFVAYDSNDVWSHPELFLLDDHGAPTVVAGVPPDAFSASGQRWGNPLYRWDVMAQQDFAWWIERLRAQLSLSDLVRIDHFIGFTRCWAVPPSETTASHGRWIAGPGAAMALAVRQELGRLPVIAEDLGLLTPEAEALRDRFDLPGMEVLQFAFGGDASNRFLPHHYRPNCVVYTGTHDNDTTVGWFQSAPPQERSFAQRYLARSGEDIAYDVIRAAMSSVAIAVENALSFREIDVLKNNLAEEKLYLEEEIRTEHNFEEIIGKSLALKRVLQQAELVAQTGSTVLIVGETGTGKELLARASHHLSPRREHTFVKVNCAAIPSGLLESELFGHEKGAFTGAIARRLGRFELAHQGTIFLDEVGDVPLEPQPKLLRVLQEQEFERLGSSRTMRVETRVVAATNADLARMVADKQFRRDLYYRLNVFPITVPPLRERPEDIPLLVHFFAHKFAKQMKKPIERIPAPAMAALTRYPWPGNIRELQNLMERAVILSRDSVLEVPLAELQPSADAATAQPDAATLEAIEREHILRVLRASNWVIGGATGASARLGLPRTTLNNKLRKLGITRRHA